MPYSLLQGAIYILKRATLLGLSPRGLSYSIKGPYRLADHLNKDVGGTLQAAIFAPTVPLPCACASEPASQSTPVRSEATNVILGPNFNSDIPLQLVKISLRQAVWGTIDQW